MKRYIILSVLLIAIIIALTGCNTTKETSNQKKIVTSFYPMYVIALNLTDQIPDISVENMTNSVIGCIHNYTLQTSDLKKIDRADAFIKNGLGLENFMDKIISSYPKLNIIDASEAELNILEDEHEENGHVWTSIKNYKKQVQFIADKLSKVYPEYKEKIQNNEKAYISKLDSLNTYKAPENTYVISCNEALEYMLEEANLKVISVYSDHDESALSSGKMADVINKAKANKVKIIFIDVNDSDINANILARETGAKIVRLDSCLSGENSKDSYIQAMDSNIDTFKKEI